jgi:ABC-type nitrate/sulfonate/bicarbonate transport system ATPase subunit
VLDQVGLAGMGGRRPADLSGGQQGRAALARLLLQDRPVALLDEPFAALDPGLRTEMLRLSATSLWEARGLTYVMATHDLRDAERLCDRVWLLEEGRVVLDRPVAGLREDPPEVLARPTGALPTKRKKTRPGAERVSVLDLAALIRPGSTVFARALTGAQIRLFVR